MVFQAESFRGLCHSVFIIGCGKNAGLCVYSAKPKWVAHTEKLRIQNNLDKPGYKGMCKQYSRSSSSLMMRTVLGLSGSLSLMAELEGMKYYV